MYILYIFCFLNYVIALHNKKNTTQYNKHLKTAHRGQSFTNGKVRTIGEALIGVQKPHGLSEFKKNLTVAIYLYFEEH